MNTTGTQRKAPHPARTPKPPAEGVLDRLFVWLDISLVRQAAGELARECHIAVWQATCEAARGMSRDEARGYIRAYAPHFLDQEVDVVLQRRRVRDSLRQRILAEAVDQVVDLVIKDLYRTRARKSASKAA